MKEASVFSVIIYLFKSYFSGEFDEGRTQFKLLEQLENEGFSYPSIFRAFDWLARVIDRDRHFPVSEEFSTIRVYTAEEINEMDSEAITFLTMLEQQGILKPHTREMIISQALTLEETVDLDLIRWVTLLVLFTHPDERQSLAKLDLLMSHSPNKTIH